MSRTVCIRWLLVFALMGIAAAILVGAALPLDANRHIDLTREISFKSTYNVEANWRVESVLFSARKLSHIIPFALVFALTYLAASRKRLATATFVTAFLGIVVELEQGFIATRSAKVEDLAALLVAIPLAYLLVGVLETSPRLRRILGARVH